MHKFRNIIGLFLFVIFCLAVGTDSLLLGFLYPFAILNDIIRSILTDSYKYIEDIDDITLVIPCLLYFIFKISIFPIIYKKSNKSGFVFKILEKIRILKKSKFFIFIGIIFINIILFKILKSYNTFLLFGGILPCYISLVIYYFIIKHKKQS